MASDHEDDQGDVRRVMYVTGQITQWRNMRNEPTAENRDRPAESCHVVLAKAAEGGLGWAKAQGSGDGGGNGAPLGGLGTNSP